MYAKVIVNHKSRSVDRVFDYEIPREFEKKVNIGSRVIVPFSAKNAETEAFVVGISDKTNAKKIKCIISVPSDEVAFLPDMVPLIKFMHRRFLATYLEIIHTIIPTGTAVKTVEWIIPTDRNMYTGKSKDNKKILDLLEESGGMDIYSLRSYFDKNITSRITSLEQCGALSREYRHSREVNKKHIRAVRLCTDIASAEDFCKNVKSKIQSRMVDILLNNDYLSTADLVRFSAGNYSALQSIVKNGVAEYFDLHIEREAYETADENTTPPAPTLEQAHVINTINEAVDAEEGGTYLLHGVTGSGKTEVFMRVIDHAVKNGKTALMLIPEISLTPQTVQRFTARFGERIAILHSGLSMGQRYDQWNRIINGEADIVIGARSAVFAPLKNIGAVIVDEEHSETYKSETAPRYHAVETAVYRAYINKAVAVLASATPSLESYTRALRGKYHLLEMKKRYNANKMPLIHVVDMRKELENGNKSIFSKKLVEEIKHNLENGEQTILFMNRRGYSTFVSCRKCGFVPMCPNCNISLTYHSYDNSLKCHYCGHKQENYSVCPMCESKYIRYFGGGTQKVEEEVKKIFPNASTIRMDADVTTRKNSHKEIFDKFAKNHIDILIGTQMVAKGLDFANVTLVGVVSADTMLHINDFRSGERTFDTLEQVSGRAGRGDKQGRAVIQTYDPQNFAVELVKDHDYVTFYRKTAAERRLMWYPPFAEMICVRFTHDDKEITRKSALVFKKAFGDISKMPQKVSVLGPIPSGVSRIKNKYRWQILIKCDRADALNERLLAAADKLKKTDELSKVIVSIDKNPINIY